MGLNQREKPLFETLDEDSDCFWIHFAQFDFYLTALTFQIMIGQSFLEFILEDAAPLLKYRKKGVGTGHSKNGPRRRWKKKYYFERNLLAKFQSELQDAEFRSRFAGYSPRELTWFFETIKDELIRPRETRCHAMNKLLLWLDKLHNCLSGLQMKQQYQIGIKTAYSHVQDVLNAVMRAYENKNVIRFPTITEREQMVHILKTKRVPMPDALFSLDGSHARCTGRHIRERLSFKYRWLPCFNVLFVTERVLSTICAFSIDPSSAKHDITVLREAPFFQKLNEEMDGWVIMADRGYVGINKPHLGGSSCIAPIAKKNMETVRPLYSKKYWKQMNIARGECERVFGQFFHNQFTQLGKWPGKSQDTFTDFSSNVVACIILYNLIKTHSVEINQ